MTQFTQILVPVDFSECSDEALRVTAVCVVGILSVTDILEDSIRAARR